jgi:hypothetical protein
VAREPHKYLLYLDILGFSDLVLKKGNIDRLYNIIDSLNAFKHDYFKAIGFSDTLLIYNTHNPKTPHARQYLIMFLCEFAKDLFYRLIGKDIHFRAYLARGAFKNRELKNIHVFYGEALIRAYRREGEIQCCGLFIENDLLTDCDVFHTTPYDDKCHFVHLMQSLDHILLFEEQLPIPPELIVAQGMEWFLAYDFTYLREIYNHMNNAALPPRVRVKYGSTWQMIRARHKALLDTLERNNFDPRCVSDFDWSKPMMRVGTKRGFHG